MVFNDFCKGKNCPEYIEWDFGHGTCFSCKKIGQSYDVNEYPDDCLFLSEIKAHEKTTQDAKPNP